MPKRKVRRPGRAADRASAPPLGTGAGRPSGGRRVQGASVAGGACWPPAAAPFRSGAGGLLPSPGILLPVASPLRASPRVAAAAAPCLLSRRRAGRCRPRPWGAKSLSQLLPPLPSAAGEKRRSSCGFRPWAPAGGVSCLQTPAAPPLPLRGKRRGGGSPHPGRPYPAAAAASRRARVMAPR